MYPMDRIQQKHARQIDLLENLTAVIQDYPNPACIRGRNWKIYFLQYAVFMSHFLHKIKVLKNGFCRREIFVN